MLTSNRALSFLESRGLPHLLEKLRDSSRRYAVTGSLAASFRSSRATPRVAMVYVDEIVSAGRELGLRPAEAGANVKLLAPFDDVVFERTSIDDGLVFTAVGQVAVDLLTSSGRGPQEAEELLGWMKDRERDWLA